MLAEHLGGAMRIILAVGLITFVIIPSFSSAAENKKLGACYDKFASCFSGCDPRRFDDIYTWHCSTTPEEMKACHIACVDSVKVCIHQTQHKARGAKPDPNRD